MESLEPSKTLVDQAYERILDTLCNGVLKAGKRVTQEEVASRLNVSRQPVTHALAILKSQGFLAQEGRRGLTVTAVQPDFFEAIYQLRSAVDPLAVRLATPRMDAALAQAGRLIIERGRATMQAGDSRAVLQADMDFHNFIYDLSGNALVADTMRLHWLHFRRGMRQILRSPGMSVSVWREHERILDEMRRGDADAAAGLMHSHIVDAYQRVVGAGNMQPDEVPGG